MFVYGWIQLARGLRRGVAGQAAFGLTLVLLALLRRKRPPEVLYQTKLKPGQSIRIERPGIGQVDVSA